jgi:4-azaleucine resistance transporter AzlC
VSAVPPVQAPCSPRASFLSGLRDAVPFALAGAVLAISFGAVAQDAGLTAVAAVVMSAIVFAGSAQFAAVAIIAQGGTVGAAIAAAAMMNARYLPMGAAVAASLPGGPLRRAAQAQALVDPSWVLAARGDGTFDRWRLFGATAIQYATWFAGTLAGASGGALLGDPRTLGLDAVFPAFYVALLLGELRDARSRGVAALGAGIALALVPFAPPGVPILVASVAALVGLQRRAAPAAA